ncbi:MAG TPA: 1-deoxy-D-xylulose-5-phosphate reductoisomerase [Egibacteraceae bacterium]|nr:1-deoxy-D-xylulose-5-phosphate reductoisomerase [Egibacteraceae bacterium]
MTILGSTGSIGRQALQVVGSHPDRFAVAALAAGSNIALLVDQVRAHRVPRVAVADRAAAAEARAALGPGVEVLDGADGVVELAGAAADVVLNGLSGSLGLEPTLAALAAGSRLALANKESLVVGGPLVLEAATGDDQIVPVDSEHSAIFQCLRAGAGREVTRLVLTASGGPFRGRTRSELAGVTADDALAHPTWNMGPVITVNSATLANKGLEVIEARLLFGVDFGRIEVVVHPQSVVHGMVEFCDGATVAKLSPPDMRLPIQLALSWPQRLPPPPARMDWTGPLALEFEPLDADTFPMVALAVAAGRRGATFPAVLNAANEEAVAAFLEGRLDFLGIPAVVEATLEGHEAADTLDLATVLAAERWARRRAREVVAARTGS